MLNRILLVVVSAVAGGIFSYVFFQEGDLLVSSTQKSVVLSTDIVLAGAEGRALSLPAGTSLMLEGAYQDEAYLYLRVVSTRSDIFEDAPSNQEATYYFD